MILHTENDFADLMLEKRLRLLKKELQQKQDSEQEGE